MLPSRSSPAWQSWSALKIIALLLGLLSSASVFVQCMTDSERDLLKYATCAHTINCMLMFTRQDARYIFYHGLEGYEQYAFPEDELRPLSCRPLTRDREHPAHIEVNDVLGNYSLTIIDSLSTLAVLASSPTSEHDDHDALKDFQRYTRLLVEEYGDGSEGPAGQGRRARGFDLDSKVQVFETTIRGLGGLLSAHLFASGDLPIRGYNPVFERHEDGLIGTVWEDGFVYNGQFLRLAYDLGTRLLPAFHTPTGLPYPRINLRYGTPFYENSPFNNDPEHGKCDKTQKPKGDREITETCSAGAGSLVLEFTTLSRLTGDPHFERLAKRAFWAVWERRSGAGLIGAGIDAETGQWVSPFTGIGAGIDSFFEYSVKSYILLSGLTPGPESEDDNSPEAFLRTWHDAHAAIMRHIYRGSDFQHPHYAQNDLFTGGPRYSWIDSLSAYYPGLLALVGELEEAIAAHLLYTALWTRYGALPERWNTHTANIDSGLGWWGGRPEFIESTWYIYRATQDPWYLHVGEMTVKDIKRRCYTKCGWAGLQDVRNGEQKDRMESFFLGETAKYLYLLFDPDHPLNKLDAPWVFTTEGHPLVIPEYARHNDFGVPLESQTRKKDPEPSIRLAQCPLPPQPIPLTVSVTAARPDVYHAASLARLHLMPRIDAPGIPTLDYASDHPSITLTDVQSPSNFTYYPWTLPPSLIPYDVTTAKMHTRITFDLTFPALPNTQAFSTLQRVDGGILISSVSGLRFGMVYEPPGSEASFEDSYRIYALSNLALGRDERIYLSSTSLDQVNPTDPHLTRLRNTEEVDLIIDAPPPITAPSPSNHDLDWELANATIHEWFNFDVRIENLMDGELGIGNANVPEPLLENIQRLADSLGLIVADNPDLANEFDAALRNAVEVGAAQSPSVATASAPGTAEEGLVRYTIPAMLPTGLGAAPLPLSIDNSPDPTTLDLGTLTYRTILVLNTELCTSPLPASLAAKYNVLVIRRGGCSFSDKLTNIPSFAPSAKALQLVIVASFPEHEKGDEEAGAQVRPLLDQKQVTRGGIERRNPIPLLMVRGGEEVWAVLSRSAKAVGRLEGSEVVVDVKESVEDKGKGKKKRKQKERPGLGVKRKYWFTTQGVRIANLFAR
ncbi:hypothetical protein M8818_006554 [Zalaria obscura]|uniref:Uncharacterized protein n=1 Tax=Zalaria obscura TaxID=2024903 RepID=A0ACC3S751_9PEZI